MQSRKIRVLVVDDSLFMRTLISDMLNSDPGIEVVGTANDGTEALTKIPETEPDCVTLDLAMPRLDGFSALKRIMAEHPVPVIILSAHSKQDADITLQCLHAGAISFVLKPSGELSLDIENVRAQLLDEVKAAAKANMKRLRIAECGLRKSAATIPKSTVTKSEIRNPKSIIVIGASTGGPQTLEAIFLSLPPDFSVPIIVVQHMPSTFFSEGLASRLDHIGELDVKVAENNETIQPGKAYVVPSGRRLSLRMRNRERGTRKRGTPDRSEFVICLNEEKAEMLTPSIDATIESVVKAYDGNTTAIILTGIGNDGVAGMRAVRESGGNTIAQDESSLIFGMPKAVIDAGLADKVLPVGLIAQQIAEC